MRRYVCVQASSGQKLLSSKRPASRQLQGSLGDRTSYLQLPALFYPTRVRRRRDTWKVGVALPLLRCGLRLGRMLSNMTQKNLEESTCGLQAACKACTDPSERPAQVRQGRARKCSLAEECPGSPHQDPAQHGETCEEDFTWPGSSKKCMQHVAVPHCHARQDWQVHVANCSKVLGAKTNLHATMRWRTRSLTVLQSRNLQT